MSGLQRDMVDGLRQILAEQREKPGECALTLVQFDSNDLHEVTHDAVPVEKVPDLTPRHYRPRGMTPLLEALGNLIERPMRACPASTATRSSPCSPTAWRTRQDAGPGRNSST